ncbi:hypothetical protein FHS00_001266 [Limimaricola variabilis]|uniref:CREG-like beta-barrel domain-containing protein n=1 Tax=Limimaricola variabilis TaxID=1492771 RepID=A0ABR6HML5_9RHOB|nr:pyridoxamine 5-phosphate oxidase [Limimaricola variabilis]MBB3711695.1 hypothetical protein [Limimaricola variabilis]
MTDPIRPTDDGARRQARRLRDAARHGVLGVLDPVTGRPQLSRVALLPTRSADLLMLVSTLSRHWTALEADPRCALMLDETTSGDPMAAPRLSLDARALPADKAAAQQDWLAAHPGAEIYYHFADFRLLRLEVEGGFLVGGFGRAFHLTRADFEN